jgi:hypothetical protein
MTDSGERYSRLVTGEPVELARSALIGMRSGAAG